MLRAKLTPNAGLTAVTTAAVALAVAGFTAAPVASARPARTDQEVIKIVGTIPGPRHAKVTATGAFYGRGYFFRRRASLIFPSGRLAVHRVLLSTTVSPPNLATCWFKEQQSGTFRVFYGTGKFRHVRYSGTFTAKIAGRLKKIAPDECGSKIEVYDTVTYETGIIPPGQLP
jgi:hypothetical protein